MHAATRHPSAIAAAVSSGSKGQVHALMLLLPSGEYDWFWHLEIPAQGVQADRSPRAGRLENVFCGHGIERQAAVFSATSD